MLGKRSRPTFRRASSMTEFTLDVEAPQPPPPVAMIGGKFDCMKSFSSDSSHGLHTADFLRSCGLCNRPLAPARDIYMYRGDTAFCSLECREQQMKHDERKERLATANNGESHRPELVATTPEAETVVAA